MKVRIGNDICLNVALISNSEDYINIKSLQAYLIKTTETINCPAEEEKIFQYIGRFPIELGVPAYNSTKYNLCHCGNPTFHVRPVQNVVPVYAGFGVYPHTFDGLMTAFDPYYNHLWSISKAKPIKKDPDADKYLARVYATRYPNKVKVYFPAEDQKELGTYKLVIVAKIYEPGYGSNNLKTVTMDYKEVFTLVGSSDEADVVRGADIYIGNNEEATDVVIEGENVIGYGKVNKFTATVIPIGIDEDGVSWKIVDDPYNSFSIVSTSSKQCMVLGQLKSDTSISYTCRLVATSKKTPEVFGSIELRLADITASDKFVTSGRYTDVEDGNKYIRLGLNTGDTVDIDTTKETVWYEG